MSIAGIMIFWILFVSVAPLDREAGELVLVAFFVSVLWPIFHAAFSSQRGRFIRLHIVDGEVDLTIIHTPDLRHVPPSRRKDVIEGCYARLEDGS